MQTYRKSGKFIEGGLHTLQMFFWLALSNMIKSGSIPEFPSQGITLVCYVVTERQFDFPLGKEGFMELTAVAV